MSVGLCDNRDLVIVATRDGRALICKSEEVNLLAGAGRGVMVIKVKDDDAVLGAALGPDGKVFLEVETSKGKSITVTSRNHEVTARGGARARARQARYAGTRRASGSGGSERRR